MLKTINVAEAEARAFIFPGECMSSLADVQGAPLSQGSARRSGTLPN